VPAAVVLGLVALLGLYTALPDGLLGGDGAGPGGAAGTSTGGPRVQPTSDTPEAGPTSREPDGAETTPPPDTWSPTPEETTSEVSDGTIPAAFDGTWEGTGFQPRGEVTSWTVEVRLDEGETTGEMKLEEFDCSGTLTLTAASERELEFDAVMDDNPGGVCAERALVRLSRVGDDRLGFLWQHAENPGNQATGVLSRH
jgi:hypothetical protein